METNGELIKRYGGGIKAKEGKFDNAFFGLHQSFFFDTYKLTPEDLRQWYEIDLPHRLLYNCSQLIIACSLGGMADCKKNQVVLLGDYKPPMTAIGTQAPAFRGAMRTPHLPK